MPINKLFPTIIIGLSICASMFYIGTDTRMVIYWLSAAILNASVTY